MTNEDVKSKYEGKEVRCLCPVCGEPCYVAQVGYHNIEGVNGHIKQMHVGCAESTREVFCVYQADKGSVVEGNKIVYEKLEDAANGFKEALIEAEFDTGYAIVCEEMSNLEFYSLKEFEGF